MTTMATRRPSASTAGDGHGLPPVRRRIRVPVLLGGLLLVLGSALAFGLLAQHLTDTRPVLALARPVARGTVLTDADLRVVQVNADAELRVTPAAQREALLGSTLLMSLPAGSPVTPDHVAPAAIDVGPATRTVGLALDPGGYPTASLAPGDTVSVIGTNGRGNVLDDHAVVLASHAAVEGSATLLVSVTVDSSVAAAISSAAARDQVRLVLHGAAQ